MPEKKPALIVVDMLKDFIDPGGVLYCGEHSREIIPAVKREIDSAREKGIPVIFVNDTHAHDDSEFRMFPPHCVVNSEGAEMIPEISPLPDDYIVKKNRYSAFFETGLEELLQRLEINHLIIVGVCSNICVLYTSADALNREYSVEVPADAVTSFDREAHEFALKELKNTLGANVREN
ncbi:MAG: cysteine hydrolase [Chloroflexi bacterium]|nr:cysteine hydrolase [Chloroflexota bacterium]